LKEQKLFSPALLDATFVTRQGARLQLPRGPVSGNCQGAREYEQGSILLLFIDLKKQLRLEQNTSGQVIKVEMKLIEDLFEDLSFSYEHYAWRDVILQELSL